MHSTASRSSQDEITFAASAGSSLKNASSNIYRHHDTLSDVAKSALDFERINNASLGFGKVFLLSLPERSDKRDAVAVQASLSNFTLTVLYGVNGDTISEKALPYTMDLGPGQKGCWRGHLDVAQKMVMENIQTALVFEDDADWDVALHAQLKEVARGTRWLGGQEDISTLPHSPYGDDWDLLWLGHCSLRADRNDDRRWVIPKDPTAIPLSVRQYLESPRMDRWTSGPNADPQTRLVLKAENGVCANGYALSLEGARKMLYRLSMMPYKEPVDVGMGMLCENAEGLGLNFTCIAPFPEIIGVSRPAGRSNRGSDIDHWAEKIATKSWSERVMFPVRQNIPQLLNRETTFISSYPDITGATKNIADLRQFEGHGEHIDLEAERQMIQADRERAEAERAKDEAAKKAIKEKHEGLCKLADSQDPRTYDLEVVEAVNHSPQARIAKVSAHFGTQDPAYEQALRTHSDHANRHGYSVLDMRSQIFDALWNKPAYILSIILAELQKPEGDRLEWLFWFDRDTVILNQCMPLHIFLPPRDNIHVIISNDFQALNNGVFAVRVSEWSIRLYGAILGYRELRPGDDLPFTEQSAMERVLLDERFASGVAYYPQRWFNAYGFQVKDADLLVHFAGMDTRKEEIVKWIDKTAASPEVWSKDYRLTNLPQEISQYWAKFPQSQEFLKSE
ncbi:hypothetical protein E4T38_09096 [Aureobasidium subglaciale]|nr:hypothetical protein E4T38_09096 [Aureobasidium subglaciale]